jgi:hypothetical protein
MNRRETGMLLLLSITAVVAWVLANGLDVLSVLYSVQLGNTFAFTRYHPAEFFLIYAGMRMLGTMAVWLLVVSASKRWPSVSRIAWSALTGCALITAIAAWWRLYQ